MAKTKQIERALGANLNDPDARNIRYETVAAAKGIDTAIHPKENITNTDDLPVEDQGVHGTCVGQAEGKGQEYRDKKETGVLQRLSKKFIYKNCKDRDGYPGQGTYPKIAAKVLTELGTPIEALLPDKNNVTYDEYMNVNVEDPVLKTEASARRTKGYTQALTLDEVKTAIDKEGTFNASMQVGDWSKLPVKPKRTDGSNRGWHRIMVKGYKDAKNGNKDDTKIYFRNSWGTNWARGTNTEDRKMLKYGDGWFWWSEYYPTYLRDMQVYTDIPNEIIDYAKSQGYTFTKTLRKGSRGTEVMELQKRLDKEIAYDGKKCYVDTGYDTIFGSLTEQSVKRYQQTKGLKADGIVGRNTRAKLNENNEKTEDKGEPGLLGKWADAIQEFEGWFPGSRSYRNNNPGNIRYIGQKRAIGQDDKNFCIFKTYADGRAELIALLERATAGRSRVYSPNMTLLQFFKTYAPSSDNNHPETYANYVARKVGVPVSIKIKELLSASQVAITKETMNTILQSPAKIVFILIAITACIAFMIGLLEAKDFMLLAGMAFGFYFATPAPMDPNDPAGGSK